MALSSAAARVDERHPGPKCGFGEILRGLSEEDLAFFEEMKAANLQGTRIAEIFREDGHHVSGDTVRRHMRGLCSCR